MDNPLNLRIRNAFAEIPAANEAATQWLAARKAPPGAEHFANLAIEELATNLIKYGYDDAEEHIIEFELSFADGELVIVAIDDGHLFNPLEAPEPETNLPVEERPIGGMGIHLLRHLADSMDYERREGKNRLTLRKSCARPPK